MPVIDHDNIVVLREKVDAWREVEHENLTRYCEIFDILLQLTEQVDGHPSTSVKLLGEIKDIVSELSSRIPSECTDAGSIASSRWSVKFHIAIIISIISCIASAIITYIFFR